MYKKIYCQSNFKKNPAFLAENEFRIGLYDSLSDDEQDQKLDELQLSLNITDEEIDAHLYDKRENWLIILSNGKQFIGFPRIDETTVEWR